MRNPQSLVYNTTTHLHKAFAAKMYKNMFKMKVLIITQPGVFSTKNLNIIVRIGIEFL